MWWDKRASRWNAQITVAGIQRHLGTFTDEDAAGRAYDAAAREAKVTVLNFPVLNGETEAVRQQQIVDIGLPVKAVTAPG